MALNTKILFVLFKVLRDHQAWLRRHSMSEAVVGRRLRGRKPANSHDAAIRAEANLETTKTQAGVTLSEQVRAAPRTHAARRGARSEGFEPPTF